MVLNKNEILLPRYFKNIKAASNHSTSDDLLNEHISKGIRIVFSGDDAAAISLDARLRPYTNHVVYFKPDRKVDVLAYLTAHGWDERYREDEHEAAFLQWLKRLFLELRYLGKMRYSSRAMAAEWTSRDGNNRAQHNDATLFGRLCRVIEGHDIVTEILSRMSPANRLTLLREVFASVSRESRDDVAGYLKGRLDDDCIDALMRDETDEERAMGERGEGMMVDADDHDDEDGNDDDVVEEEDEDEEDGNDDDVVEEEDEDEEDEDEEEEEDEDWGMEDEDDEDDEDEEKDDDEEEDGFEMEESRGEQDEEGEEKDDDEEEDGFEIEESRGKQDEEGERKRKRGHREMWIENVD
jgi:hypothetical protein